MVWLYNMLKIKQIKYVNEMTDKLKSMIVFN